MFSVQLAGRGFRIENRYPYVRQLCQNYITPEPGDSVIAVTEEEILREQTGSFPPDYLESIAVCRKIADALVEDSVLLFHSSVVAVDGEAYLFTAASGYGKSTHTRLWRERFGPRAVMINDDKPFLKITDEGVLAYGSPWDGKHHLSTNISAPLKAFCILEHSDTNRLEPIPRQLALVMMIRGCHRPSDPALMKRTLDLIEQLDQRVKTYRMWCNMEPEAAQVAYDGMTGGGNQA